MNDVQNIINKDIFRKEIVDFEKVVSCYDGSQHGDCFPLKNTFADGIYIREINVPASTLVVTKIFKQTHATFLMSGEVSIISEKGVERISAPKHFITKAGTKRVILCHTDVVWVTVHSNPDNEQEIEKIENFVIAKDYDELLSHDYKKNIEMAIHE